MRAVPFPRCRRKMPIQRRASLPPGQARAIHGLAAEPRSNASQTIVAKASPPLHQPLPIVKRACPPQAMGHPGGAARELLPRPARAPAPPPAQISGDPVVGRAGSGLQEEPLDIGAAIIGRWPA